MPDTFTSLPTVGDLLRSFQSQDYCFESRKVLNSDVAEIVRKGVGTPVKDGTSGGEAVFEVVFAGDEANATAILIEDRNDTIAASGLSDVPRAALVRGPAVISIEALPANDPKGAAYNKATLATALNGVVPMIVVADNTANKTVTNLNRS